jgi:flavin-dependent dehydrogenase
MELKRMSRIVDAAIIGAGLAGSCLAKELADRGWSSLLLDSARFPRHKVCGEFVSPEARSTLLRAGLLEYVEALQPVRIERIRIVLSTGETLDVPLPGAAMGVSRYALDPALHRAVSESGAEVLTGTTVTSIERSDAGFRITAKQGRHKPEQAAEAEGSAAHSDDSKEWQAKVVIAAWGANRRPVVFRRGLQTANAGVSFVQVADSVEAAAGQGQARVSMGGRKPLIESGIQTAAFSRPCLP